MRKHLIVVFALGVMSLMTVSAYAHHIPPAVPAPNFTLTDIDGNTFKLSDYSGKRVLLEFFSIL